MNLDNMASIRTDIQALRGLAVLLVVLHHSKLQVLSSGFLGVDIFFVISGFLITGLIKSGIESGRFRFSEFYFRRAKRLLPAAYVTFFVTALLAPLFLNTRELTDFALQMLGAVTFTGNLALWQQTDYFQSAGELKPFLHVWSLAIEEQYYFLLPAVLVFIPPRRWLLVALIATIGSFALCILGGYVKPVATFYLLPTRAWEMALGSVGALIVRDRRAQIMAQFFFWPSLLALLALPFFSIQGPHPGGNALIVCLATLVVIIRNHSVLNTSMPARFFAKFGDFSYSLYLVHWPIISYANNAWAGDPPAHLPALIRWITFILSLVLGYLLYRLVEVPIRRKDFPFSRLVMTRAIAASVGLVAVAAGFAVVKPQQADYRYVLRANYGFSQDCEYSTSFTPLSECRNSDIPVTLVWGDSFAMHLVPGLAASDNMGIIQATRSACGPLLDIAPVLVAYRGVGMNLTEQWAKECIEFNRSVLKYLSTATSVEVVVLSSPFWQYLKPEEFRSARFDGSAMRIVDMDPDAAVAALRTTVSAVRELGKRVVVVGPPPSGGFNIGGCLERLAEARLLFGAPPDCEIQLQEYRTKKSNVLSFLARLPGEADVEVFEFDAFLCNSTSCKTSIDGVFIYRDAGHFSYDGSKLIASRLNLGQKLGALAR